METLSTNQNTDFLYTGAPPLWERFTESRAYGSDALSPVGDLLAPLAALLVLRWAAFMEAEQEAVAAFDDASFSPWLPPRLRQDAWQDSYDLARRISDEIHFLDFRHDVALAKYVGTIAPLIERSASDHPELFRELVTWVARVPFGTADGRDDIEVAFDALLTRAVRSRTRDGGEFTTPQDLADLMVELVDPRPGERVYDPCFGLGGLLVTAARRLRSSAITERPRLWQDVRSNGLFGVELRLAPFAIGLCRLILAGIDQPGIEKGDALARPLPRNRAIEGFDCILAAPPWGGRADSYVVRQYPFATSNTESLFLQHVMANLRAGGRAVIAVPEGMLFRGGADRNLRKSLLTDFRIDGVVSLPPGAFLPYTGVKTSLVVFRRAEPKATVRFLRARLHGRAATDHGGPEDPVIAARALQQDISRITPDWANPGGSATAPVDTWLWDVPVRALAKRDYELIAKRTGAEELDETLQRLESADPELTVKRLEELARVSSGASYKRELTAERRSGSSSVPLVRVGDIVDSRIKQPTLFFADVAVARVSEHHRLQPGDVLVTSSGTVGKVAVLEDESPHKGAVAANTLIVVRPWGDVVPEYLAALLRSPSYQEWIAGHSRGAVIQHLSVQALRRLPVPVPSISLQHAVVRNLQPGGDAVSLLLRLVIGGTADPIATWLERPFVVELLSEKTTSAEPAGILSEIGRELQQLAPLRNRVAHNAEPIVADEVALWLMQALGLAAVLTGIEAVPEGSARLAAFEIARARAETAARALDPGASPQGGRLRTLMLAMIRLIETAVARMIGPATLSIRADPEELFVGVPSEVGLHLINKSWIGLRSITVRTRPDVGSGEVAYLGEDETAVVPLTIEAQDSARSCRFTVHWTGFRLDGTPAQGEEAIELLVRSTREAVRQGDLGASPYLVGPPVEREEMFYGRTGIIEQIQRQLGSVNNTNVILLEGNRRTGKTSILVQLEKRQALPDWVPVYCNFQEAQGDEHQAGIPTRNVYRYLALRIGFCLHAAGIRTWFPGEDGPNPERPFKLEFRAALSRVLAGDYPFEAFESYLAGALESAQPRRILLMIDEFDKLQEGIDAGVTSPQVPENLRHILQHHRNLSAIISGSRRLKRLREEYWSALFGLGYRIGVSALSGEDARRLVTEPVEGRLTYLPQARDRLVDLCACQPFLIQSLCSRVFDLAALTGARTITAPMVDEAAEEMVQDNEHFRTLWDYARTERRRLILMLCERATEGPDAVTLDLIGTRMEDLGVAIRRQRDLVTDIEFLRELELIEFDESYRGGTYRIAVPLFGTWIRTSIDFNDATLRAREEAQENLS